MSLIFTACKRQRQQCLAQQTGRGNTQLEIYIYYNAINIIFLLYKTGNVGDQLNEVSVMMMMITEDR